MLRCKTRRCGLHAEFLLGGKRGGCGRCRCQADPDGMDTAKPGVGKEDGYEAGWWEKQGLKPGNIIKCGCTLHLLQANHKTCHLRLYVGI
ncbi:hypothetical protein E2C01_101105 [Portunus trituberculatus]|uniref:Uncharacterized protein n=1 Tax=Portunus trituberculatus TaxID=210409 RepID=A0A5B7KES4_PORTR|nr:hypothetical protein [Portunus trituberculatus]